MSTDKITVRYVCPDCGEESLYADASIYWDVEAQSWELGGDSFPDDRTTLYCGDCGAECCGQDARKVAK